MVKVANAGIPACRTVASHTARPEYQAVILKWLIQVKTVWLITRKVSVHFASSSADAIRICIFKQLPNYNIQQFFLFIWMSINVLPLQ